MSTWPNALSLLVLVAAVEALTAGEISQSMDPLTKSTVYSLRQNTTLVQIMPAVGANVYSIRVGEAEYLRQPESLDKLGTGGYGNPVLYPTPNRVKGAQFVFRGREFQFPPNSNGNFIHGLVRSAPWTVVETRSSPGDASITCGITFEPGSDWYERFPLNHRLLMTVTVSDSKVRWEYQVDNRKGLEGVPFGFALHPYFVYQGERKRAFLTIPATHWMESTNMLPTGKLIPASALSYPLGDPMSMEGMTFDDVFYGLDSAKTTLIDFRDVHRQIQINASDEFTHLVVWTPAQSHFGIESQTCSTDAHNLAEQGSEQAAHLQVCEAGGVKKGWVEYTFRAGE
jgi:aldose 1-epimerase